MTDICGFPFVLRFLSSLFRILLVFDTTSWSVSLFLSWFLSQNANSLLTGLSLRVPGVIIFHGPGGSFRSKGKAAWTISSLGSVFRWKKNLNNSCRFCSTCQADFLNVDTGAWIPRRVVLNGPWKHSGAQWQCPEGWDIALKDSFPPTPFQVLLYHPCDTLRGNAQVAQMH